MIENNKHKSEGRQILMRIFHNPLLLVFILFALVVSFWGCGMLGDRNANFAPTVNFVNTPKDASLDSSTSSWVLNMPFTLFGYDSEDSTVYSLYDHPYQLVQFPDTVIDGVELSVKVEAGEPVNFKYYDGSDTTYLQESIDYTVLTDSVLIIQAIHPDDGGAMKDSIWSLVTVPELSDTMIIIGTDTNYYSIDTLVYFADFKLNTPNFYVFSYAPIVNWYGTDQDGFVEYYQYFDADGQVHPGAIANPDIFKHTIADDQWVTTNSTFTTIYLMSAEGDTTEHVVFLRCFDNEDAVSTIKYRTFFRSNKAPDTPEVKWDEMQDSEYDTLNYIALDAFKPQDPDSANYDTLYCLENVTPVWNGIILRWRGTDPDDKELITIPLTFKYYLIKADEFGVYNDTIPEWTMPDHTDEQDITIVDLETGSYKFMVYSYDDGFEESPNPGILYFRCIKPTFEHSILIYDETIDNPFFNLLELPDNTLIDSFYVDMLRRLQSEFAGVEYGYDIDDPFDLTSGTQDVVFWNNNTATPANVIPVEFLSKFRMVLFYAEDHKLQFAVPSYTELRDEKFLRYLNVGGRLWVNGRCLLFASFPTQAGIETATSGLLTAMQVSQSYVARIGLGDQPFEFIGAVNAVDYLDTLEIDTVKLNQILIIPPPTPSITGGLPEIDWSARDEDATTLYYFNSITGALSEVTKDSLGTVMNWTDPGYDTPTGSQCWITVPDENITSVSTVYNADKDRYGEVITVTSSDDISVSYMYEPIEVTGENSLVLNSSSSGGNYTDPTQTTCNIRTVRYDQEFHRIYNATRSAYAEDVSSTRYDVQVVYPDTIVTIEPGYFDYLEPAVQSPADSNCVVVVEKSYIDDVLEVVNVTQNWTGTFVSRNNSELLVSYTPRTGQTWLDSDSIMIRYTYHQYWEVGDVLEVDYTSDKYWEKGDVIEVSYNYNPVTDQHLKPVAIRYEYFETYNYTFNQLYYRTSMFTFPMYFMKNDTLPDQSMGKVDKVFYEMLDWFLYPDVHTNE